MIMVDEFHDGKSHRVQGIETFWNKSIEDIPELVTGEHTEALDDTILSTISG